MTPEDRQRIKNELVKELRETNGRVLRESIVKLKDELREAIEKDKLKQEIITETKPKSRVSGGFFKHPATLLVLGFMFTTGVGGFLTWFWKERELNNERSYLATQTICERERLTRTEEIKQKTDVKDEIIKRVAETNTAAEEILGYFDMEPSPQDQEREERSKYWKEASRAWRTNEKILKQRLLLRFSNPNVSQLFDEIVKYRNWVGINIKTESEEMAGGKPKCHERLITANSCMGLITKNLMPKVIKIMNEEIWADERALRAARCVDNTASNVNVNATSQFPSPSPSPRTSEKKAVVSVPCPEVAKKFKMCGVDGQDTNQDKPEDLSEASNACMELRDGMADKCQVERDSASQNKSVQTATPNKSN
jgi:hypothetical protein